MTRVMAAHVVILPTTITLVIGLLAMRTLGGTRAAGSPAAHLRTSRSGAMFRFRPTQPGLEWEPLRITVGELRVHGLRRWPNAPGVYLAWNSTVHCRYCIADPRIRAPIVAGRDVKDQVLVLFGGPHEAALVEANCSTHRPQALPPGQRP